jgi:hypothetical protein
MAMHDCAWVVCIRCIGAKAIGKKDPRPSSRNDIPLNYPHRWPSEGDFTRWVAPETSRARLVLLYIHSPTHTHPRPRATHASDHRRLGLAAPPRPGPARPGPTNAKGPRGFPRRPVAPSPVVVSYRCKARYPSPAMPSRTTRVAAASRMRWRMVRLRSGRRRGRWRGRCEARCGSACQHPCALDRQAGSGRPVG